MEVALDGNFTFGEDTDPWAYFYSVKNDTESERYFAWLNALSKSNHTIDMSSTQPPKAQDYLLKILKDLRQYYTPFIIGLGVLGNTITWLILLRSRLRTLSSSHYLAAIVMVNTIYLLSILIHWLSSFVIDIYNRPGWCQFVNFINSTSSFLSVWYLAAFAIDRYICICWPTEAPKMCTRMRARVVIICLLCIGIVVFMNISLTVGIVIHQGRSLCNSLPMFFTELQILEIIDMVINIAIPYLTILILTLLIAYNTCRAYKQRVLSDDPAQIRRVTIVFLSLCLTFHLPSELLRMSHTIVRLIYKTNSTRSAYFAKYILQHLFHTSLALHFVLFWLCYPMFAQTCHTPFNWLRKKLLRKFRKAPNGDIHLRNVRFHAVKDEANVAHV